MEAGAWLSHPLQHLTLPLLAPAPAETAGWRARNSAKETSQTDCQPLERHTSGATLPGCCVVCGTVSPYAAPLFCPLLICELVLLRVADMALWWGLVLVLLSASGRGDGACAECHKIQSVPHGFSKVTYASTNAHIENPSRGFLDQIITSSSNHHPLTVQVLDSQRKTYGQTLVWRTFVLDTFVESPISSDFLKKIQADLQAMRDAGFKGVIRFCYIFAERHQAPFGDASKNVILHHIEQLKPIFHQFADVILSVMAGFIGAWGEWHHSTYFDDPHTMTQMRKEVLMAEVNAVPKDIQIQIRTPRYKMSMFGTTPATFADVVQHHAKGRIGHHNDCFLLSDGDAGTYKNKAVEYPYLTRETQHLIIGGETCGLSTTHRHECPTALKEMAMFHWTYLNRAYNKDVLGVWKKQGCFEEVHRRLGYRLELKEAVLPSEVSRGRELCYFLLLHNLGFAAPVVPNDVTLVLHSHSSGHYYGAKLPHVDIRHWLPGQQIEVTGSVHVTSDVPEGDYDVYLAMGEKANSHKADYYILLANQGVPIHKAGLNDLKHRLRVRGSHGGSSSCTPLRSWHPPSPSHYSRVFSGSFS